jgi:hypothetical protein
VRMMRRERKKERKKERGKRRERWEVNKDS